MAKRVYWESVKNWLKKVGIVGVMMVGGLFLYLMNTGAITVEGFSGDQTCSGTLADPCYAYINFTANEDIFIYPIGYDPWGRDTIMGFDPAVKDWKFERSWGDGWRNIPLNETCTGTWCGLSNSKDTRKFSVAFREGKYYKVRIVAYKNDPRDEIKWGAFDGLIDPTWVGTDQEFLPSKKTDVDLYFFGKDQVGEDFSVELGDLKTNPGVKIEKYNSSFEIQFPPAKSNVYEQTTDLLYTTKYIGHFDGFDISYYMNKADELEWEVLLDRRPNVDSITFPLKIKGLNAYFQGQMDDGAFPNAFGCNATDCWDEKGENIAHMDEKTINSWAIYTTESPARKFAHLDRARTVDSKGNVYWLDIKLTKDSFTIYGFSKIPKTARGLVVDPTFGITTIGASNSNSVAGSSYMSYGTGNIFSPTTDINIHEVCWGGANAWSGTDNIQMALYNMTTSTNPDTRQHETMNVSVSSSTRQFWCTTGLDVDVSGGSDYAIGWGISTVARFAFDRTSDHEQIGEVMPLVWDATPTGSNDFTFSVYINYTEVSGGADNPPEISLTTPANTTSSSNTSYIFSFDATDDIKVDNITLQVFNSTGIFNSTTNTSGVNGTYSINISDFIVGDYDWNVIVVDNTSQSTTAENFTLTVTGADTCTYSGSGDWLLDMEDMCTITVTYNLGGSDINFTGTSGWVNFTATMSNVGNLDKPPSGTTMYLNGSGRLE